MSDEPNTQDDKQFARLRALYALSRLSEEMRAAVLADKEVIVRFELNASRPQRLDEGLSIDQNTLFKAFTKACGPDAGKVEIAFGDAHGPGRVRLETDGSCVLALGDKTWRFRYAGLLDSDRDTRITRLDTFVRELTLSSTVVAEIHDIVSRGEVSHDGFLDIVQLLQSAPEYFQDTLIAKVSVPKITIDEGDLLPDDLRYWENLAPLPSESNSLEDYLQYELRAEEGKRSALDRSKTFQWRNRLGGSPEADGHKLFMAWPRAELTTYLEGAVAATGHFALLGSFELCARKFKVDDEYIVLGNRILTMLVGDPEQLKDRCEIFATAFVLATARLATHEITSEHPVFWRRLVAVAHAEIVTQAFSSSRVSADKLLEWALGVRWREFVLSVRNDLHVEPRWMPEWIGPDYLMADVLGRVRSACLGGDWDDIPESWKTLMEPLEKWVTENKLGLQTMFPSVLQGAPARANFDVLSPELQEMMNGHYQQLASDPSPEHLIMLLQWVETVGVRPGSDEDVLAAVMATRSNAPTLDNSVIKAALTTAARIAVLTRNVRLAEAVAETLLNFSRGVLSTASANEVVFVLLECSGAWPDHEQSRKALAAQLEQLAFRIPKGEQSEALAGLIGRLQAMDKVLAPFLGRALTCASLGAQAVGSVN